MTRRLLAATTLLVACAGFSAALVVPASADTVGTHVCVGTTDRRSPGGYAQSVCL